MPSKLRKALGAVKDQTSISLAKVTNAANLEVTILKATTHDEIPIEERYVNEIVQLVSSNKVYAAACAQAIGKRIGKTRNWVVALKSLMIVLRIFQDGDPYFPREVFHAMKRGSRILNLSSFRDDSSSSPWDYTAFVRTFALYLDERLDCFITGKLQRRFTYHNQISYKNQKNKLPNETGIKDMKPTMLLDRVSYWQRLLDRAIGTRPTGSAKTHRLVQISLYAIVQETFDLYRDISDGLAVILDSFFQLPCQACFSAFQACVKSAKQFDELSGFYSFCASIGIGRTSEYPTVQKVSEELMEALQEFLKDQASFPADNVQSPLSKNFLVPATRDVGSSSRQDEAYERYGTPERYFENGSQCGSQCPSLGDLLSADAAMSPRRSFEQDMDTEQNEQDEKESQNGDLSSAYESDTCSTHSNPVDQTARSSLDLVIFDDFQPEAQQNRNNEQEQKNTALGSKSNNGSKDCWELVLAETATTPGHTSPNLANGFDPSDINTLFDQSSVPQNHYNPFLEMENIAPVAPPTTTDPNLTTTGNQASFIDLFQGIPSFQVMAPAIHAQDPSEATMAPAVTAQSSNSETNLALTFGDVNQNTLTVAPTFHAQGSAGTNKSVAPTFLAKNLDDEMNTAPAFYAQRSLEVGSAPSLPVHDPYHTSIAPTFNSRGSFTIGSASTPTFDGLDSHQSIAPTFSSQCSGSAPTHHFHDSYYTSTAPTFRSQGSFKIGSASAPTFRVNDSQMMSTRPTFNSQGSAPTLYVHDSHQTSTIPNFNSQDSFKIGSAPTLHFHGSYQMSTAPTYNSQGSFKIGSAPTLHFHGSYQMSTAPTYNSQDSFKIGSAPTFHVNDSHQTNSAPTFNSQGPFKIGSTPTFHAHDSHQMSTTPTFSSQGSFKIGSAPTSHVHDSYQTSTSPTFNSQGCFKIRSAPNLLIHDSYQTSTAPNFRTQNVNMSMAAPVLAAKNPNKVVVPSTFGAQNFYDTMAEPTFSTEVSNEMKVPSSKEDDPFGPWPNSLTNEHASNQSMQEQNLVQQQRMWLEQQNKIIAKNMP